MNIENLILGVNSVTVSYLIHYDSLLQNATVFLLQNATVLLQNATVLLQNATVITKCDVYYKFRQCIYPFFVGSTVIFPYFCILGSWKCYKAVSRSYNGYHIRKEKQTRPDKGDC